MKKYLIRLARFYEWVFAGVLMVVITVIVSLEYLDGYGRSALLVGLFVFFIATLVKQFDDAGWFKCNREHRNKKGIDMKRLKPLPWYWYGFFIVIFLCLMEIRGILGNWSTIVLVAFTMIYVMLIYKSISQTSILRREDRELDFKLRKLDWIVNTAREIKKELLMPLTFQLDSTVKSTLIKELQSYAGEWIITIDTAKIFGDEFERIVEKAEKDLFAYIKELEKPAPDHKRYIMGLNQSFSNVLKSALKVEHGLVNKSQDVTP